MLDTPEVKPNKLKNFRFIVTVVINRKTFLFVLSKMEFECFTIKDGLNKCYTICFILWMVYFVLCTNSHRYTTQIRAKTSSV